MQRYLNTARSLCKVQVPRFALRNWAPLTSSRFLSTEAAVEEDDEDVVGYVEYDMFDETYMTEKEKAYIRKIERGVGDLKKFAAETPVTPEEVAQCIVNMIQTQLEENMDVVETVPEQDYATAVDIINQEKIKLGLDKLDVEPRRQLSLRQMFQHD
ncbi:hypothetical protein GUITHDRAFT_160384 [Guillardia theta CCMP2712]|uniref:Uncharacterized protein n=1 Tax=Guillardia theta (strain CCMP2712) TaxID=905079 RepID=L1K3H3_GUITC|nr:hypothetical protein GUITHDRAFT_160384 [Guillardia theta CCMP2712]EKX55137.1 hypothetical protein GUITHDRAFT_160384 [Guillardia theta CCMP2712]|eukprot:XP_005842117.1 hypothetical protein GUITHDRAFT_160384 [Guillardia theta CCMP2712]